MPKTKNGTTKICSKCRAEKLLAEFHRMSSAEDGYQYQCKACMKAVQQARGVGYREQYNMRTRLRKYGLTQDQFRALLRLQQRRCPICQLRLTKKNFAIDHDHETGKVRGILCKSCNMGLGLLADDATLLLRGAEYLTGVLPSAYDGGVDDDQEDDDGE